MLNLNTLPRTSTITDSDRKAFVDYLMDTDPSIDKDEIQELNAFSDEDLIVAFTGYSDKNEWQLDIDSVEEDIYQVGVWRTSLETPCAVSHFVATDIIQRAHMPK